MGDKRIIEEPAPWPTVANIGLTTRCNGKCPMCHAGALTGGRDMTTAALTLLLAQLLAGPEGRSPAQIQWTGNIGEPTLVPEMLLYAVRSVKRPKPEINQGFFTNCSGLTPRLSQELITAGLSNITFSLDAPNKALYAAIRPGLDYDEIIANINAFLALNAKAGKPVSTRVHMVAVPATYALIPDMRKKWESKADSFTWLPQDGRGGVSCLVDEIDDWPCHSPFGALFVEATGVCTFCCQDQLAQYPMGRFPKESVMDIWYSNEYERVREAHLAGTKRRDLPLCAKCHTYY